MDSFTQELIQDSLTATSEEMFAAMARAAMSSVIYEVLDFGVAITDAEGNLASVGAGIPGFVGMLAPAVHAVLGRHPRPSIAPGDIFIANDPYEGGVSHANDVVLAMPVFFEGRLIAWTANKGHWVDIGGMTPGSMSPEATELFQEGLILPPLKLFEAGSPVEAIFEIIRANSRLPDQALGDLWAGVAALRLGERRLRELCGKHGRSTLVDAIQRYMDYGETMARNGLTSLPEGEFRGADRLDDGREIRALIRISGGEMTVDLRDNPDQDDGPVNGTRDATLVGARAVFKSITLPEPWANAGCFRPLKVLTRPGSIFDALRPAAVGLYYENKMRSKDLILKTLAPHMPDRLPAGHFSSICATVIRSQTPGGPDNTFVEPQLGGWGAGHDRDGDSAQFSISHGDTFNCPVEVNESRNGIHVRRYALNPEAAGAGRFGAGRAWSCTTKSSGAGAGSRLDTLAAPSRHGDSPAVRTGPAIGSRSSGAAWRRKFERPSTMRNWPGVTLCGSLPATAAGSVIPPAAAENGFCRTCGTAMCPSRRPWRPIEWLPRLPPLPRNLEFLFHSEMSSL